MSTPSKRAPPPVPPDKGSFPLDHFGQCTTFEHEYLNCLKANNSQASHCRIFMKQYLQCRMENGLMAKEDLSKLGFRDRTEKDNATTTAPAAAAAATAKTNNAR